MGKLKQSTKINGFVCTLIEDTNEIDKEDIAKLDKSKNQLDFDTKKTKKLRLNRKPFPKPSKSNKSKNSTLVNLPRNVETKIYKFKKSLQKKNLDAETIRQLVRRKRRDEENKYHKSLKHICFKCRKPGHLVMNCPSQSADDQINICYFCGSSEHNLSKCETYKQARQSSKNEAIDLPFVKCFICHEKGHLTRNCSKNDKGAFPLGGKCRQCGSINHSYKDCFLNNDDVDRDEILLKIFNPNQGVEIDEYSMEQVPKSKVNISNCKIVEF
ncbi:Zinc finger CCHC domain-containing protein 9 [Sarcoptes scabiei]|uniref:Zinc finger CCHC domain-containing protein 9 n=1 Tax=Sarcoptes scabiei TaxID=52283 RepID=A0A834QZT1_SARSC|nr:Zinc finger CCHC domain-containing protein 9 [Sarcoptes scabiei]UXI17018.1 COMM domain-containing protein 3-like [Sarcoptes scabiei]